MLKVIGVLGLVAGLSACALQTGEQNRIVREELGAQSELILKQQATIELQQNQMKQLRENQQQLSLMLTGVSEQIDSLHEISVYQAAGVPLPSEVLADLPLAEQIESEAEAESVNGVASADKLVLGRNEWVWIDLLGRHLKARVDTGSSSSTFSAEDVQPFERNGERWVSFSLPKDESKTKYETRLVRFTKIRQVGSDELERRAVVKLVIRMGDLVEEAEFTLTNREKMLYPITLGRSFLRDIVVVDVARKFTQPRVQSANTAEQE